MEIENQETEQVNNFEIFEYPKIYSEKAIWGFSVLFTSIFGGVLLMQNLKIVGKNKEANKILAISILFTIITIAIVNIPEKPNSSISFLLNMAGGGILSKYYYPKYFPNENDFTKKPIWKPLIISIIITIPFLLALIYG